MHRPSVIFENVSADTRAARMLRWLAEAKHEAGNFSDSEKTLAVHKTLTEPFVVQAFAANRYIMAEYTMYLTRMYRHANWQDWPEGQRPSDHIRDNPWIFSHRDVADMAIAREETKKPHDFCTLLAEWIDAQGDIALAKHLFNTGKESWMCFALVHAGKAAQRFYKVASLEAEHGVWPKTAEAAKTYLADTGLWWKRTDWPKEAFALAGNALSATSTFMNIVTKAQHLQKLIEDGQANLDKARAATFRPS